MDVVAMQAAGNGIGQCCIHVVDHLARNGDALAQAVVERGAVQSPQHQKAGANMKALGEGGIGADQPVNLGFLLQAGAPRAVDLHHEIGVVRMLQHRGVIAAAQGAPGMREMPNPHRIMGIGAMDLQLR
jgi:hypothetical protein